MWKSATKGKSYLIIFYLYRFRQRTTVLKRYYIAQCRNQSWNLVNEQDLENEGNLEENKKNQVTTSATSKNSLPLAIARGHREGGPTGFSKKSKTPFF